MSLTPDTPAEPGPAAIVRGMIAHARTATLATLDTRTGHPYASLVTVATGPGGPPVLLLSGLALHTRNILADRRASLLLQAGEATPDPLAAGRVTLIGAVRAASGDGARRRFLDRHPQARAYADFADFAFYELEIERAHYIGGFGRIVELPGSDLVD